jgi:hypothetical protein
MPSQSLVANCERCVNWYPEVMQSQYAPTGATLYPTPGTEVRLTVPKSGARAFWSSGDRAFSIFGDTLYEVYDNWAYLSRGTVVQDSNPATISYNGITGGQLFITSGTNGYTYDLATNTLTTVLAGEATMGGMLNARFLAFNVTNGKVRLSGLNDGLTWDPLLYFQRTLAPDPWQAMVVNGSEIWMVGQVTGEVWYDSGAYPQPMAPVPGSAFSYGTPAPFSVGMVAGSVVWVARTAHGQGMIVGARGYTPQEISNFSVATALSGFSRTSSINDAEILVYEQDGHQFACWSFPSAKSTWVYDATLGAWHERGTWSSTAMAFSAWSPRVHGFAFGQHLVGSRTSGALLAMDVSYGTDNGATIRRLRIPPPLWAPSSQRIQVSRLEVICEPGLGTLAGQGADPKMMMRTSNDAKTWSSERLASAGKMGDYSRRLVWNRCGSSDKLWVPELTVTDPIPWRLAGATLEGSGFQQQGAR